MRVWLGACNFHANFDTVFFSRMENGCRYEVGISQEPMTDHVLLDMIDRFLDGSIEVLCRSSQVCRDWNDALSGNILWRTKLKSRFGKDPSLYHPKYRDLFDSTSTSGSESDLDLKEVYAATHVLERRFSRGTFTSRGRYFMDNPITCIGMSGSCAYVADSQGNLRKFDTSIIPDFEENKCHCLEFTSPVSSMITTDFGLKATGHSDGTIRASNSSLAVKSHEGRVNALVSVGESGVLSVSPRDASLALTDLVGNCVSQVRHLHVDSAPNTIACSDTNTTIAGCRDDACRIYDLRAPGGPVALVALSDWCLCVESSGQNPYLFRASDKAVHLFDLRNPSGGPIETLHKSDRLVSKFRSDFSLRLVSCGLDGELRISSLESQQVVSLHSSEDYILATDFDRTTLCCGGMNGKFEIFYFNDK